FTPISRAVDGIARDPSTTARAICSLYSGVYDLRCLAITIPLFLPVEKRILVGSLRKIRGGSLTQYGPTLAVRRPVDYAGTAKSDGRDRVVNASSVLPEMAAVAQVRNSRPACILPPVATGRAVLGEVGDPGTVVVERADLVVGAIIKADPHVVWQGAV